MHFAARAMRFSPTVATGLAVFLFLLGLCGALCQAGPAPAPPPAVFENRIPGDHLKFLNDYAGKTTKEIRKDKRFRALLKQATPRTTFHYGRDMSLDDAVDMLLDGRPMPVDVHDGRYAMVTSGAGPYLRGHAFVWFDMQEGIVLGGVFFHPTNGEPTPTLAIFSRQLNTDSLQISQLPVAFQQDLAQWSYNSTVPPIPVLYFIPENGKKYPLIHDEDFCAQQPGLPPPPPSACMELNAEAADADMNAAYFMHEVHNAANGTAWMLDPEQVAWIGMRERTCGMGAAALPCRIRVTRIRTRTILRR